MPPIDAHLPRQRPTTSFDWGPRKALTELRPRHLHMVEEHAQTLSGWTRLALRGAGGAGVQKGPRQSQERR
jgi:hypothetical protein